MQLGGALCDVSGHSASIFELLKLARERHLGASLRGGRTHRGMRKHREGETQTDTHVQRSIEGGHTEKHYTDRQTHAQKRCEGDTERQKRDTHREV